MSPVVLNPVSSSGSGDVDTMSLLQGRNGSVEVSVESLDGICLWLIAGGLDFAYPPPAAEVLYCAADEVSASVG